MPSPFSKHFAKLKLTPSPFNTKEWARVDAKIRAGSFFSATVEDERLLDGLRGLCQAGIDEGWSESMFVKLAKQWMSDNGYNKIGERVEHLTPEESVAYENNVRFIDSRARLKLIFRTQAEMAAGATQYARDMEPRMLYLNPGWLFVRREGAKTKRQDHVDHENETRLKTDEAYWLARNDPDFGGFNIPHPPFGFNSWMWVQPVSRKGCVAAGIMSPEEAALKPKDWLARQEAAAKEQSAPTPEQRAETAKQNIIDNGIVRTLAERSCKQIPEYSRKRIIQRNEERGQKVTVQGDTISVKLPAKSALDLALQSILARIMANKPVRANFKTQKEFNEALELWQKKIKYLQSEL